MLSPEELAEIEARANAATEGPWEPYAGEPEHVIVAGGGAVTVAGNYDYEDGGVIYPDDLTFIIHARKDVPALLAEVERQQHALNGAADHVARLIDERDRARRWAVAYEQQLAEIKRLAYQSGASAHAIRRSILRVFEEANQ